MHDNVLRIAIPASVLVFFVLAKVYFLRRPPEISDIGLRHFRNGLRWAIASSLLLNVVSLLPLLPSFECFDIKHSVDTASPLLVWLALGGNVCNLIGVFSFTRVLIRLITGGTVEDITPEGMIMGLLMCFVQILWLLTGVMLLVSNGF